MTLPLYECHAKLGALKIKEARVQGPGEAPPLCREALLIPENEAYPPIKVDADFVNLYHPTHGGYLVERSDGLRYWLQAYVFESDFHPVTTAPLAVHALPDGEDAPPVPYWTVTYPCKCSASGFGTDPLPNYCPEHGKAPKRPTIEQLEKILANESDVQIHIHPDGSVTASDPFLTGASVELDPVKNAEVHTDRVDTTALEAALAARPTL